MKLSKYLLSLFAVFTLSTAAFAGHDVQYSTPIAQGYDVVSYHTLKRPVRGNGNLVSVHDGATYLFSTKENMEAFEANPSKYAPAYGGYCAFGVSVGKKFIGDPEVWRVVDDRLFLNLDVSIQQEWLKDVPGRIKTADKEWPQIKDKSPASL